MSELLNHWKLVTRPFEAAWDTRFFYRSEQHQEALDRLIYLAMEGGMGVLTGSMGCGKTLTRSVFQHVLPVEQFRIVVLENSGFSVHEIVRALLRRLGPPDLLLPEDALSCEDLLQHLLATECEQGRQVVVILDEAQDLSKESLHELRRLTNFNGSGSHLITIILVGLPELQPLVESVPSVEQRIGLRYHLAPLSEEEVSGYLAHRLHVAGHPSGCVFDPGAGRLIYQLSQGVPREINRLAKLVLEYGWLCGFSALNADHVGIIARDMRCHPKIGV